MRYTHCLQAIEICLATENCPSHPLKKELCKSVIVMSRSEIHQCLLYRSNRGNVNVQVCPVSLFCGTLKIRTVVKQNQKARTKNTLTSARENYSNAHTITIAVAVCSCWCLMDVHATAPTVLLNVDVEASGTGIGRRRGTYLHMICDVGRAGVVCWTMEQQAMLAAPSFVRSNADRFGAVIIYILQSTT